MAEMRLSFAQAPPAPHLFGFGAASSAGIVGILVKLFLDRRNDEGAMTNIASILEGRLGASRVELLRVGGARAASELGVPLYLVGGSVRDALTPTAPGAHGAGT